MTRDEFKVQKADLIRDLVTEHIEKVERIEEHSFEQCQKGEHLLESYATGGRGGHCISRCLLCKYRAEGWD